MSINHFSSDLPETIWWAQPQYHHHHHHHHNMATPTKSGSGTTTASTTFWGNSPLHHHHRVAAAATTSGGNPSLSSFNFDLNNEDEEGTVEEQHPERGDQDIPKEPLFEKPLTPSDVGKLNRLVIPKQHAEKYFPLNAAGGNETGTEKGLLLSFEDELGKPWRFRYSYWNSSQSYVLTKGWSRFVKEKKLDAGDIVLFERHRLDCERMYIGWRRRASVAPAAHGGCVGQAAVVGGGGGGGGWTRVYFNTSGHNNPYPEPHHHPRHGHGAGFPYQPDHCLHAAAPVGAGGGGVLQHRPAGGGAASSKRLRLFGVNLECHPEQEGAADSDHRLSSTPPEASSTSSVGGGGHDQQEAYYPFQYYSPTVHQAYYNHQNHMNINFSRDAKYQQG